MSAAAKTRVLDHIGVAVRSLDEGLAFWRDRLGLEVSSVDEVPSEMVKVAFLELEGTRIELLEPTSPDSPIALALEKRGPGVHHLAFQVDAVEARMKDLAAGGARLLSDAPKPGAHGTRCCFIHPKSAGGVLVEIVEHPGDHA